MIEEPLRNKNLEFICKQNFDGIIKQGSDFFCTGCNKNILDFRNKTQKEFLETTKNKKNYCGIYRQQQVSESSFAKSRLVKNSIKVGVFTTLFALFSFVSCKVSVIQNDSEYKKISELPNSISELLKKDPSIFMILKTDKESYYLSKKFPFLHKEHNYKFLIGF